VVHVGIPPVPAHSSRPTTLEEATRKRESALGAALEAGFDGLVVRSPPTVRWLLCGRGQPVDVCAADYTILLLASRAYVLHMDIEESRVAREERLEELGFERVTFPWHAGPDETLAELLGGARAGSDAELEPALASHRRELCEAERERYRAAGAAAADVFAATLETLAPGRSELDVAGELAGRAQAQGLVPRVVLVAGAARQRVHRHPLPTRASLGPHALLALTAEREGLFVSLTRLVSFGAPPAELARLVRACAEVDAGVLTASRPGARLGELLEVLSSAYEEHGFPGEWRRHHQGGLTGYKGREVFATPGEPTRLPPSCAVAWNPSIAGGAKSEDTALVAGDGVEIVTATPGLPVLETGGPPRPGIAEL
jgi:antitoxin VapB